MTIRPWFILSIPGLLALLACDEAEPSLMTQGSVAASASAVASTASVGSVASSGASRIRLKAFAGTPVAKLGTVSPGLGIEVGKDAPKVKVRPLEGSPHLLEKLYQERSILLVFYRGGWCPFCNFQVRDLVKHRAELGKLGIDPVLISVDKPDEGKKTQVAQEVPFTILSDSQLEVHRAFNVLQKLDTAKVESMKAKGTDLAAYSGQNHNTVAVPSMFLIDTQGKVRFAHADTDYKVRPEMEALLAKLGEVTKAAPSR